MNKFVCALVVVAVVAGVDGRAQAPIANAKAEMSVAARPLTAGSDPAASSLDAYLTRVRADNKSVQATTGAIWTDAGRLTRMSTDVRAMRPHDLIQVVVSESLAASTDGTVKNSRRARPMRVRASPV
jgi:flagellar basal body L-ring protein FlgH